MIRLLRGDGLLDPESSADSLPPPTRLSTDTDASSLLSLGSSQPPRRVRSLLSGAEAVEVGGKWEGRARQRRMMHAVLLRGMALHTVVHGRAKLASH